MKPADRKEFARLLTDVHAYYKQDCSKFVLDMWWSACQSHDLEQISKALNAHAVDPERGRYCPRVADVVKVLSGTATDRAALAWGKTLEAMGSVGAYSDVVFDDPAIHAVVDDMGGWPKCCRTEAKELGYLQHRFCESYRAYAGRGSFEYPRRLMGDRSPDGEYERRGLRPPLPALIGSPSVCKSVFLGGNVAGKTQITHGGLIPAARWLESA